MKYIGPIKLLIADIELELINVVCTLLFPLVIGYFVFTTFRFRGTRDSYSFCVCSRARQE